MSRLTFVIIWTVLAGGLLTFMVLAWRARKRRDSGYALPSSGLVGESIATFTHAGYVSTTPTGAPFERIAVPGLAFKGWADVTVREDGVTIEVTGEQPVEIARAQILGSATASGRAGKAVERDGLALLRWAPGSGSHAELESSFRFDTSAEQIRFADAIALLAPVTTDHSRSTAENETLTHDSFTTQEDA